MKGRGSAALVFARKRRQERSLIKKRKIKKNKEKSNNSCENSQAPKEKTELYTV